MIQTGIKKKQGSIVEVLKEEILSGNIPGGTEMTQKELAESLGVSRMPVREALILLEYQGLIERLPNNHVRVTDFTEGYFHEIFAMCMELEKKVLEAGFVLEKTEKRIRFADIPEEMLLHQQISQNLSNMFLRKMLNTILEIYVDFAVRSTLYDREKGTQRLKEVFEAASDKRVILLEQYFNELEKVILNERKMRC